MLDIGLCLSALFWLACPARGAPYVPSRPPELALGVVALARGFMKTVSPSYLPRQAPPASYMEAIDRQQVMLNAMSATSRRWEREGVTADKKVMPTTTWAERMTKYNNKRARQSG